MYAPSQKKKIIQSHQMKDAAFSFQECAADLFILHGNDFIVLVDRLTGFICCDKLNKTCTRLQEETKTQCNESSRQSHIKTLKANVEQRDNLIGLIRAIMAISTRDDTSINYMNKNAITLSSTEYTEGQVETKPLYRKQMVWYKWLALDKNNEAEGQLKADTTHKTKKENLLTVLKCNSYKAIYKNPRLGK